MGNGSGNGGVVFIYLIEILKMDFKTCGYCGKIFSNLGWPHIEGDSNRGVLKIEHFCCEEHKESFLKSKE